MNTLPKLHNATWPGLVGKGPDSEPVISFDQLLEMTAAAEVGGVKFDGIDVGLLEPHIYLDQADEAKKLGESFQTWAKSGLPCSPNLGRLSHGYSRSAQNFCGDGPQVL
jgi:hypothetical protein